MSGDAGRAIEERLLRERGLVTRVEEDASSRPEGWLATASPQGAAGGTTRWEGRGDSRRAALEALERTVFADEA